MLEYCLRRNDCDAGLPFSVTVLRGSQIAPLTLSASSEYLSGEGSSVVTLRLQRPFVTRCYVIVVSVLPLVLGLLLYLVLFSRRLAARRIGVESLAGLGAVLLAVLPIRLVLVPSEMPELTLVDYWLGFEMALLTALACIPVWRGLKS